MKGLIVLFFAFVFVQQDSWDLIKEVEGEFVFVEVDEHGSIYLINKQKHLIKLNAGHDTTFIFNRKSAEVDFVAPQNTLKILSFNQGLNAVQFLDKTLSPSVAELDLDEANLPLVEAIGMSRDNNFWVFDQDEQALKKLDTKMNVLSNSGNIINITHENWSPIRLKEIGDKVYVNDSLKGLMEFDFFGTYIQTIRTQFKSNYYVTGDRLWFIQNDSLVEHDLLFHSEQKTPLPQKNIKDFAYYKSQLYLLTQEKLYIYGLSKN